MPCSSTNISSSISCRVGGSCDDESQNSATTIAVVPEVGVFQFQRLTSLDPSEVCFGL